MPTQEKVDLTTLGKGDLIRGISRLDLGPEVEELYTDLLVVKPGERPVCLVSFTDPRGTMMSRGEYLLEGSSGYDPNDGEGGRYPTVHHGILIAGEEILLRYPKPDYGPWRLPKVESFEVYPNDPPKASE